MIDESGEGRNEINIWSLKKRLESLIIDRFLQQLLQLDEISWLQLTSLHNISVDVTQAQPLATRCRRSRCGRISTLHSIILQSTLTRFTAINAYQRIDKELMENILFTNIAVNIVTFDNIWRFDCCRFILSSLTM